MELQALGMIETRGLIASIEAADAMLTHLSASHLIEQLTSPRFR